MTVRRRRIRLDDGALARLAATRKRLSFRGMRRALGLSAVFLVIAASAGRATRSLSASQPEEQQMKYPLGVMAAAAFATSAFGTDRLVPQQYPTIQAAVNASVNGDRVLVGAGLYRESVSVTKSVTIEAEQFGAATLTGVGVSGPCMVLGTGSYGGPVVIRGLIFDGQGVVESGQFAGLSATSLGAQNELIIERCVFKDLRNAGTDGGAIWLACPLVTIRECKFIRNQSTVHGAAIYAYDNISPLVERCVFIDHTFGTGTFYARVNANLRVRDCVVRNSNVLTAHFQTGVVTLQNNTGCQIGALSNGGYVDGGGNDWDGPCPDCDANGVIDLEEILFGGADCNGNSIVDACDLSADPKLDRNNDGVIDSCQCIPDITGNGLVDGVDLAAVLSAWGTPGNGEFDCDVSGDGIVSGPDLSIVLGGWGPCP